MLEFVIKVALVSVFIIGLIITTVVFCFWFIYLLDGIQRKLISHRNILRNIRQEEASSEQDILAYNSKTEYVKYIFLFFMNLVEWLGLGLYCCSYFLMFIREIASAEDNRYRNESEFLIYPTYMHTKTKNKNRFLLNCFPFLTNLCFMLSLLLIGSLCMYLAARFAQKSWIKSNKIPHLIVSFMITELVIEIVSTFCASYFIGSLCRKLLLTAALIFVYRQYRKLNMVINWSIVDLKVSGNIGLLMRQVKMKQTFNRIFIFILTGIALVISSEALETILLSLVIILRKENGSSFTISLCEQSHITNLEIQIALVSFSLVTFFVGFIGGIMVTIPYTAYGLSTMSVILWRLFRGKTGYRTHYQNPLNKPLI